MGGFFENMTKQDVGGLSWVKDRFAECEMMHGFDPSYHSNLLSFLSIVINSLKSVSIVIWMIIKTGSVKNQFCWDSLQKCFFGLKC